MPGEHNQLKAPVDPEWVGRRLEYYGLQQDNEAAYKKYPDFLKQVEAIISRKRDSDVTGEEQELFRATHRTFKHFNEGTLLARLLPFLVKSHRTVPRNLTDCADIREDKEQVSVAFFTSGLSYVTNRSFWGTSPCSLLVTRT